MRAAPMMGATSWGKKEIVSQIPIPVTLSSLANVDPHIMGQVVLSITKAAENKTKPMAATCQELDNPKVTELKMEIQRVNMSTLLTPTLSDSNPVGILSNVVTAPPALFKYPRTMGEAPRLDK